MYGVLITSFLLVMIEYKKCIRSKNSKSSLNFQISFFFVLSLSVTGIRKMAETQFLVAKADKPLTVTVAVGAFAVAFAVVAVGSSPALEQWTASSQAGTCFFFLQKNKEETTGNNLSRNSRHLFPC